MFLGFILLRVVELLVYFFNPESSLFILYSREDVSGSSSLMKISDYLPFRSTKV